MNIKDTFFKRTGLTEKNYSDLEQQYGIHPEWYENGRVVLPVYDSENFGEHTRSDIGTIVTYVIAPALIDDFETARERRKFHRSNNFQTDPTLRRVYKNNRLRITYIMGIRLALEGVAGTLSGRLADLSQGYHDQILNFEKNIPDGLDHEPRNITLDEANRFSRMGYRILKLLSD